MEKRDQEIVREESKGEIGERWRSKRKKERERDREKGTKRERDVSLLVFQQWP